MGAKFETTLIQRSFLSVLASAYILNALGRVADVLWLLLLFSVLSVEQVSLFALASAIAAFFAMSLDAGLNQTLLREFSTRGLSMQRGALTALRVRTILLLITLLAGGGWWLLKKPAPELTMTVVAACAIQLWILVEQFCQQWLKANGRQTLANMLATADPFFKLVAMCVLAVNKSGASAFWFFAMQNVSHCILAIVCVLACANTSRSHSTAPEAYASAPALLRASGWFAVMGLITVAQNRADWLLLANFADSTALASYSLVNRAYEVLMMLIGTGAMTLFPVLCQARVLQRDIPLIVLFRKCVLAAGTLGTGAAAILLPVICNWLWNDKYPDADTLFSVIMPVACLSTFIQMMYYEAIASHGEARLVVMAIISTLAQIGVNLALVPLWGPQGAVVGMLTLALTNIALYFAQRSELRLPPLATMIHLMVYTATMATLWLAIAFFVPTLWAQLCIGALIWAAFSYIWLLDKSERTALRRITVTWLNLVTSGSSI